MRKKHRVLFPAIFLPLILSAVMIFTVFPAEPVSAEDAQDNSAEASAAKTADAEKNVPAATPVPSNPAASPASENSADKAKPVTADATKAEPAAEQKPPADKVEKTDSKPAVENAENLKNAAAPAAEKASPKAPEAEEKPKNDKAKKADKESLEAEARAKAERMAELNRKADELLAKAMRESELKRKREAEAAAKLKKEQEAKLKAQADEQLQKEQEEASKRKADEASLHKDNPITQSVETEVVIRDESEGLTLKNNVVLAALLMIGFLTILAVIIRKKGGKVMFKKLVLGAKIGGGFAILLILTTIVAVVGYNAITGVVSRVTKANVMDNLVSKILDIRDDGKDFTIGNDIKFADAVAEKVSDFKKIAETTKEKFNSAADKQRISDIVTEVDNYSTLFKRYVETTKEGSQLADKWRKVGEDFSAIFDKVVTEVVKPGKSAAFASNDISELIQWSEIEKSLNADVIQNFLAMRVSAIYYLMRKGDADWTKFQTISKTMEEKSAAWAVLVSSNAALRDAAQKIKDGLTDYVETGKKYHDLFVEQKKLNEQMTTAVTQMVKACQEGSAVQQTQMKNQIGTANKMLFGGTAIAILIGVALAFFITRGITRPIRRIINELSAGSDQTAGAASQVSNASQQLSQGATEQAASLEETSSSLDQMSSMTKQSADNAGRANQLAQEARMGAEKGNQAMGEMATAMKAINESSDKISKILKTIEEIAFQTNLLALNAAVEAARAGEHGKGFAVVAEEVRNLAKRSATAAKDTAELIEDNIHKAKQGSDISTKASESLNAIMDNSKKVADIISEIAAASKEQAEGIGQVTNAVSQMDQVTQQNAAAAEESASASEELAAQADALRGMVDELASVVGKAASSSSSVARKPALGSERRGQITQGVRVEQIKTGGAKTVHAPTGGPQKKAPKVTKPEEVIPLDEGERSGF